MFVVTIFICATVFLFQRVVVTRLDQSTQLTVINIGRKIDTYIFAIASVMAVWALVRRLRKRP
jgi:hypothetical protein